MAAVKSSLERAAALPAGRCSPCHAQCFKGALQPVAGRSFFQAAPKLRLPKSARRQTQRCRAEVQALLRSIADLSVMEERSRGLGPCLAVPTDEVVH